MPEVEVEVEVERSVFAVGRLVLLLAARMQQIRVMIGWFCSIPNFGRFIGLFSLIIFRMVRYVKKEKMKYNA